MIRVYLTSCNILGMMILLLKKQIAYDMEKYFATFLLLYYLLGTAYSYKCRVQIYFKLKKNILMWMNIEIIWHRADHRQLRIIVYCKIWTASTRLHSYIHLSIKFLLVGKIFNRDFSFDSSLIFAWHRQTSHTYTTTLYIKAIFTFENAETIRTGYINIFFLIRSDIAWR